MSGTNHFEPKTHTVPEKLLLLLSRKPEAQDYQAGGDHWTVGNALGRLCGTFPNFLESIQGKDVLDFGCGAGYQTIALARGGARYVAGLDTNQATLQRAMALARTQALDGHVEFRENLEDTWKVRFDVVISQDSMEHFPDPAAALETMKSAVRKNGRIMIVFGCPWFSPYGSHMHFFTKVPWVNILFAEKTVMSVRAHFRSDGAARYHDVESGLNKMSIGKYEQIIERAELQVMYSRYRCVKGIDFLGKLPAIRELFVNEVASIVAPRHSADDAVSQLSEVRSGSLA